MVDAAAPRTPSPQTAVAVAQPIGRFRLVLALTTHAGWQRAQHVAHNSSGASHARCSLTTLPIARFPRVTCQSQFVCTHATLTTITDGAPAAAYQIETAHAGSFARTDIAPPPLPSTPPTSTCSASPPGVSSSASRASLAPRARPPAAPAAASSDPRLASPLVLERARTA